MDDLFLFARPPRPLWPFNGAGSVFWPPLAFASMAAALREEITDLPVAILDAPAQRMGWKSFEAAVRRLRPRYLGIGEEAVSCSDGLRAAKFAKQCGATVIAGGCFFANVASQVLATGLVDIVVHGEGEQTIVEVVRALRDCGVRALAGVRGVSYRDRNEVTFTGPRELIADLDTLPMPAFDLLPMHLYGSESRNHYSLVSLESSRGCPHSCSFCVLWRQMGHLRPNGPVPCLRTKSPERLLKEVKWVTSRFGRKYIGWVDPCFNASPTVPQKLSELILKSGISVGQSAWVRADYLRRDATSGALDICVRAGLNELYIGVERRSPTDLADLNKGCGPSDAEIALRFISENYPSVCTVGSFIYGIPGETVGSVHNLVKEAYSLPLDVAFFIPLTPLPGTPFWNPAQWDESGTAFSRLNFLPGSLNGNAEIDAAIVKMLLTYWPAERIKETLKGIFARDPRRKSIIRRTCARSAAFLLRSVLWERYSLGMYTPAWYEN